MSVIELMEIEAGKQTSPYPAGDSSAFEALTRDIKFWTELCGYSSSVINSKIKDWSPFGFCRSEIAQAKRLVLGRVDR